MSDNKIGLKSVSELLGMKFFIPSYQRGYRWTEQQVKDLLNDVNEFQPEKSKDTNVESWYCLQPLVVRKMEENDLRLEKEVDKKDWYEVIDGQQRLTTVFLVVHYFNEKWRGDEKENLPIIKYETRTESYEFLNSLIICDNRATTKCTGFQDHIDFYYMKAAYDQIFKWAIKKKQEGLNVYDFQSKFIHKTKFIWYESVDEDPIKVFTRLNIGKISLTNAELIKALFLNRSNFRVSDDNHLKLRQQEIASEWDNIEYTLQNEEFWLFLNEDNYDRPTRIDFIFDLICKQKTLGEFENTGTDDYKTFRYFYEYFKSGSYDIENCWKNVKSYFQTFKEWFDDLELYHYIGYLIHQGEKLDELCIKWYEQKTKAEFVIWLKIRLKEKIKKCSDIDKQYDIDGSPAKTTCKPLLLLHNIQTVVNQNNQLKSKEEYKLPVFYKFPFHLFKKENWDVEHIDSNTTNGLEKEKDQKEWLKYSVLGAKLSEELKEKIKVFIRNDNNRESFESICQEIEKNNLSESWSNPEQDKNKVWNFVLLDAGTNRGYGNSIFPAKRRCIIGKDQGKTYSIDDVTLEVSSKNGAIAFIPPVTKNVFLKYYNTSIDNLRGWSESDAIAYKFDILDTLKEFGVTDSSNNQKTNNDEQ